MKRSLLFSVAVLLAVGGAFATTTRFTDYLFDDPATCNNCHVMGTVHEGWRHAGHREWATCNDCHTPHDLIPKYITKATNGFRHVTAFATGYIPDAIRAIPATRDIVQANCIRCHEQAVSQIGDGQMDAGRYCFECHRAVAHGPRALATEP